MNQITSIQELDSFINWMTDSGNGNGTISINTLMNLMSFEIFNLYMKYLEALQLFQNGNYSDSIRRYSSLIKIAPSFVAARNNLGALYRETGNSQRAISTIKEALLIAPEDIDLWKNLGDCYDDILDVDNAIYAYRKVTAKVKSHPIQGIEALLNLAINLQRKNLYQEAEQHLLDALMIIKTHSVNGFNDHAWDQPKYFILYALGFGCYKQKKYDQAIKYLQNCQKMNPNDEKIACMVNLCRNNGENDLDDEYED